MNKELPATITDLLRGVNDNPDDENKAYILAATFNLYSEAIRRLHGRVLLHPRRHPSYSQHGLHNDRRSA